MPRHGRLALLLAMLCHCTVFLPAASKAGRHWPIVVLFVPNALLCPGLRGFAGGGRWACHQNAGWLPVGSPLPLHVPWPCSRPRLSARMVALMRKPRQPGNLCRWSPVGGAVPVPALAGHAHRCRRLPQPGPWLLPVAIVAVVVQPCPRAGVIGPARCPVPVASRRRLPHSSCLWSGT